MSLRPHCRQQAPRQLVIGEDIDLHLFPEGLHRKVLDGAGLGISGIVEQAVQTPARCRKHIVDKAIN